MKTNQKQLRVASYLRVSTEEQKKHGDSIATQREHCNNYFKNNPEAINVGEYCDEGISANKLNKRIELQRLLKDIEENKIDLVIFTKLDRWFRSVAKYYKIQEILENNNVKWMTLLEDYETITASGVFKVNIMLSVAQQERDKCSERIKDVFEYKVMQGHAIVGTQCLPFPFMVKEIDGIKRVVHNPNTEAMTYDWIEHIKKYNSMRASALYLNEKYNKHFDYQTIVKLSKNPMLYGSYHGNDNYCIGYMTKEEFNELQESLKKNVRVKKSKHIHLFSRMVKCPCCGGNLVGFTSRYKSKTTSNTRITCLLRCSNSCGTRKKCNFYKTLSEAKIENYLLETIRDYINEYINSYDVNKNKKEENNNRKKINNIMNEMDRLNFMFKKNRISIEEYDNDYEELEKELKELKTAKPKKNISKLKKLLEYDYIEVYKKADKREKKVFWNNLIKEIHINENREITNIIFW